MVPIPPVFVSRTTSNRPSRIAPARIPPEPRPAPARAQEFPCPCPCPCPCPPPGPGGPPPGPGVHRDPLAGALPARSCDTRPLPMARLAPKLQAFLRRSGPDRRLGPFELVEQLGHGGFAPVWLAKEVYGSTEVRTAAVKLFALDD